MARAPNYNHERKERDRIKAAKKAEKLAAKVAARERAVSTGQSDAEGTHQDGEVTPRTR